MIRKVLIQLHTGYKGGRTWIHRIALLCAAILLLLSLTACGRSPSARPTGPDPAQQPARVLFLNVGKADSALISFRGKHFLIDTGTAESLPRLVKALRSSGVQKLDCVFLTHTHDDHIGGLEGVLRLFEVGEVYAAAISENRKDGTNAIDNKAAVAGRQVTRLKPGDRIALGSGGDATFTVAGPIVYNKDDDNDNSLVLRLESPQFTCLFTGDMQFAEEQSLLGAGTIKESAVLKVGNHGNADATSRELILAVEPRFAVISTDSAVDTDTPAKTVLDLLQEANVQVFVTQEAKTGVLVTAQDGAVSAGYYDAGESGEAAEVNIRSLDREAELLVLGNDGDEAVDMTGWWIQSERGGEMFFIPAGTVVKPGGTLLIASGKEPPEGDLVWEEKNVWHDKKDDAAVVYDEMGRVVCKGE